jgi:hypothetical protein
MRSEGAKFINHHPLAVWDTSTPKVSSGLSQAAFQPGGDPAYLPENGRHQVRKYNRKLMGNQVESQLLVTRVAPDTDTVGPAGAGILSVNGPPIIEPIATIGNRPA